MKRVMILNAVVSILLLFTTGCSKMEEKAADTGASSQKESPVQEQDPSLLVDSSKTSNEQEDSTQFLSKEDVWQQSEPVVEMDFLKDFSISASESFQPNGIRPRRFYFQILDRTVSALYPTKAQYMYDFAAEKLVVVQERDPSSNQRVIDFLQTEDGSWLESMVEGTENGIRFWIQKDDQELFSCQTGDIATLPNFTPVGGKYQMLVSVNDENTSSLELLEVDGGSVTSLYSLPYTMADVIGNQTKSLTGISMQSNPSLLCFSILKDRVPYLVIYDGQTVEEFVLEEEPYRTIPLENGVLWGAMQDYGSYTYYFFDRASQESYPIQCPEDLNIRGFGNLQQDSFVMNGQSGEVLFASLQDGALQTDSYAQIPGGIGRFGLLYPGIAGVFVDSPSAGDPLNRHYSFFTVKAD